MPDFDLIPTRRCSRCGAHKPASSDHFTMGARGQLAAYCKSCTREYRIGRPMRANGSREIGARGYDDLFALQQGACGSCKRLERLVNADGTPQRLMFYAHSNGVRALICFCCNLACTGVEHNVTQAAQLVAFLGGPVARTTVAHLHHEGVIEGEVEP